MPGMTEWTQKRGEDTSTTDFASLKAAEKLYGKKLALNKEYQDREIINNLLDRCDEKQLKIIKEVLVAICPNFDDLEKK